MANTMRILGAVCWRTWLKTARRPVVLTFSFAQPIMWLLFFGFLFHRFDVGLALRGVRYLDFLLPGVCAMTVLFGASQSGIGLIRDMQTGFLQRLFDSPANPGVVLGGKLLADVVRLLAQAVVIGLLGLVIGTKLHFTVAGLAATLVALGLFAIGFCSLSCLGRVEDRCAGEHGDVRASCEHAAAVHQFGAGAGQANAGLAGRDFTGKSAHAGRRCVA
jgi:ABC-type multidrug transport system permease subunit